MNVQQKAKGFTIIEVVLVLAIAGLIFLMVFIALPALQRNQRDASRKAEVGAVASAIQSYMSNNHSAIPTADDIAQYVGVGTSGSNSLESGVKVYVASTSYTNTTLSASLLGGSPDSNNGVLFTDQIKVWFGSKCPAAGADQLVKGTSKQAAVVVAIESGHQTEVSTARASR